MIKENQHLLNQIHVITDGLVAFISMLLAYLFRFVVLPGTLSYGPEVYVIFGVVAAVLCLPVYAFFGLYRSYRTVPFHKEAQTVLYSTALVTLILIAGLYVFRLEELSRWLVVFFAVIDFILQLCKRCLLRAALRYYRSRGYNQKHVLLIGSGPMAEKYIDKVKSSPELGFLIDGYVSDSAGLKSIKHLGSYDRLEQVLTDYNPDEVVMVMPSEDFARTGDVIQTCEKTGNKLSMLPFYAPFMPSNPYIDNMDGLPLINLRRIPLDNLGNAFIKRTFDVAASLFLIVLTSPLMLIAALGVKFSSPGPILYKQERVGRGKKKFRMYKFRSMRVNSSGDTSWSQNSDSRRTRFGALIRKLSIDELPQFFNVLKGDMSLVGPRPEIPHFVDKFKEDIPRYMVKHQVRPGITGWAQVNGYRGDTSISGRIEYDIYYIENWTLLFDIRILFMTLFRLVNSEKITQERTKE